MSRSTLTLSSLLLATSLASGTVQAHFFAEQANCKAPVMPLEFVTELDKQEFDAKVATFRGCLETFVSRQNEAMTKHKQAAEGAAEQWKHYVETVLKGTLKPTGEPPATQ